MTRLRAASQLRSHHLSTFRSGLGLGLAVPALVSGVYQSKFISSSFGCTFLIPPPTPRLPAGQTSRNPCVATLAVHLLRVLDPGVVFAAGWYKLVDLLGCENQLRLHIWFVCLSLFLCENTELGLKTLMSGHG
jgi:hypothetical protein